MMMRTTTRVAWSTALGVATLLAAAERMAAVELHSAPSASWVTYQVDPAEALYRDARRALNNSDFREAARLFERLRDDYQRSELVEDSYYFEAFALYRDGRLSSMERALDLLTEQEDRHPGAPTLEDAPSLRVQIEGRLARRGNREAGQRVAERASGPCESDDQELRLMALNALLHMNAD
jgi:outer membrane protein assembly factor BamD (BamD/ComL family)